MFNTSYIQTVTACANVGMGFLSMSGTCHELRPLASKCEFGRLIGWRRFFRVDGVSLPDAQCVGKALVGRHDPS